MKITQVNSLALPEVKIIKFARFMDHRGYFTEPYRQSEFRENPMLDFMHNHKFYQVNESYSQPNVMRGLHFQWNPVMGKLLRTVCGRMIDIVMDIRKGSPRYGKVVMYDMPSSFSDMESQWIWVPPGFAHGNFFTEQTLIEYYCTGEYNPACEAGISPLSADLDFSLCDGQLYSLFKSIIDTNVLLSDKDRTAQNLSQWTGDEKSENFRY